MNTQTLIIHGSAEGPPRVHIDDALLEFGTDLDGRYGFGDQVEFTPRLLRLVLALALAAQLDASRYTPAAQLGVVSGADMSARAVQKFFELRLADAVDGCRLIEFKIMGHGERKPTRGGRSRGPYRLNPRVVLRVCYPHLCAAYLSGHETPPEAIETDDVEVLLASVNAHRGGGRFSQALLVMGQTLMALHSGALPVRSHHTLIHYLAKSHDLSANIMLELGLTRRGISATQRAANYYDRGSNSAGRAHAWLTRAYLHGQHHDLVSSRDALAAAKLALRHFQSSAAYRRVRRDPRAGLDNANFVGSIGLRQSLLAASTVEAGRRHAAPNTHTRRGLKAAAADFGRAEARLFEAERGAEQAGFEQWKAIWAMRRVQNFTSAGELDRAGELLDTVGGHAERGVLGPAGMAALHRVAGQVYIATGADEAAACSLADAARLGHEYGMSYQLQLVDELYGQLRNLRRHRQERST